VCQLTDLASFGYFSLSIAKFAAGLLFASYLRNGDDATAYIDAMAVEKNGGSVEKGQLDPNCPCFAGLNISFPEPSWNFIQRAVSICI